MRPAIFGSVLISLLGGSLQAHADDTPNAPTTEVVPEPSQNKGVADLGLNVSEAPSLGVFAGFQHDPVRVGALLDLGVTWYDWTEFYGIGVGPVLDLPLQFRTSLMGAVGWQYYRFETCDEACKAARVDESRIAYVARLGLGRTFPIGRRGTAIVVMGWFTANYSSKRQAATTANDIMNEDKPASSGGFRPGGLLSIGVDVAL